MKLDYLTLCLIHSNETKYTKLNQMEMNPYKPFIQAIKKSAKIIGKKLSKI